MRHFPYMLGSCFLLTRLESDTSFNFNYKRNETVYTLQCVCAISQMFTQQFEANIQYLKKINILWNFLFRLLSWQIFTIETSNGEFNLEYWKNQHTQKKREGERISPRGEMLKMRKGNMKTAQKNGCNYQGNRISISQKVWNKHVIITARLPRGGFHTKRHNWNIL